jgi:hypothetical protein
MTTLIIGTLWNKKDKLGNSIGRPEQSHSWETFFQKGEGLGYELYTGELDELERSIKTGSCKLVMLRNDKIERRAEGRLLRLDITPRKTKKYRRYNVIFTDQKEVRPYVYHPDETLKYNSVRVIWD